MLGLFEAGHWPCALITARQILTAKDRPFGNGMLQSGASAGAVLTPLYVLLVRSLGGGWEVVFWTIGLVGLLWVPLWFALVRRGDLDRPTPAAADGTSRASAAGSSCAVRRARDRGDVLGLSWQFIRAWLPKYLKEYHGYYIRGVGVGRGGVLHRGRPRLHPGRVLVKRLAGRGRAVHPGGCSCSPAGAG